MVPKTSQHSGKMQFGSLHLNVLNPTKQVGKSLYVNSGDSSTWQYGLVVRQDGDPTIYVDNLGRKTQSPKAILEAQDVLGIDLEALSNPLATFDAEIEVPKILRTLARCLLCSPGIPTRKTFETILDTRIGNGLLRDQFTLILTSLLKYTPMVGGSFAKLVKDTSKGDVPEYTIQLGTSPIFEDNIRKDVLFPKRADS